MRKKLIALMGAGVLLTGCAASLPDTAEKCGGSASGITVEEDGTLKYDQDADSTEDAWICLLQELVPDKSDQYEITQGLDQHGTALDGEYNGRAVVYGSAPDGTIRLFFNP